MHGSFHAIFWPLFWIGIWGVVAMARHRRRTAELALLVQTAAPTYSAPDPRELTDLRERVRVLERIATDANSFDARNARAISAEIDALRDPSNPQPEEPA